MRNCPGLLAGSSINATSSAALFVHCPWVLTPWGNIAGHHSSIGTEVSLLCKAGSTAFSSFMTVTTCEHAQSQSNVDTTQNDACHPINHTSPPAGVIRVR